MKIIFSRQEMSNQMIPLMCAVAKGTLPSTEGVLIEAKKPSNVVLTTFDLEKGIKIQVEAQVIEEGSFIINANKLLQTLRVMTGDEVELEVNDNLLTCIKCGKSNHKMTALRGSEFPAIPKLSGEDAFSLLQKDFKEMIGKTMFAMGVNDPRNVLNGMNIKIYGNEITVVACDNFKLAKIQKKTNIVKENEDGGLLRYSFILPYKTVNELYKLLSDEEETVKIYMTRKNIVFEIGDIIFFSRLVEGEYIEYDKIIPKNHDKTVYIDREEFISCLERASIITEEKIAGSLRSHVKLTFENNLLKITANSSAGSTYDEIDIDYDKESLTIGFNNRFLISSIRACDDETVKLSLASAFSAVNIERVNEKEGESEIFMILPVRLKDWA